MEKSKNIEAEQKGKSVTEIQQDKKEWIKRNICRFCIGSHLHTCTGYDCRDARKKAEEYFERVESREVKKVMCDICGNREADRRFKVKESEIIRNTGVFSLYNNIDICKPCYEKLFEIGRPAVPPKR